MLFMCVCVIYIVVSLIDGVFPGILGLLFIECICIFM